jgi:hypothetical protein
MKLFTRIWRACRDAATGRFVSRKEAAERPKETVCEEREILEVEE